MKQTQRPPTNLHPAAGASRVVAFLPSVTAVSDVTRLTFAATIVATGTLALATGWVPEGLTLAARLLLLF